MPVTAKLSKLFYQRFGEKIVNELVDLLNTMDATYRRDLRELNELNFARLDAKIEQLRGEMHALKAQVQSDLHAFKAQVQSDLHALKAELLKWMFLFWAGTALAGLLMR